MFRKLEEDNKPSMEEISRGMMHSCRGEERETGLEARIAAVVASRLFNSVTRCRTWLMIPSRGAMLRFEIERASFPAFA